MIRPIITEKSMMSAQKGWYTFATGRFVRKETISAEIKKMFKVDVVTVRTIAMHGKVRRVGRSMRTVRHEDWKKAIVQLKKGQKIDIFDVVPQEALAQESK